MTTPLRVNVFPFDCSCCFHAKFPLFDCSYPAGDAVDSGVDSGLSPVFAEYIDGARQYLESEMDKDPQMLHDIRLHFTEFIRQLIRITPG